MKQIFLFILLWASIFTVSAQITQKQADEIVLNRMNHETKPHTVFAKEDIQTEGFTLTTSIGEEIELAYPCWAYYINFDGETFGKYLLVKESNGNLLEVNVRNDEGPEGFEMWRIVNGEINYPIDIPFEYYPLSETMCLWQFPNIYDQPIIINSYEELDQYITCAEATYPEIDFSEHSLVLSIGKRGSYPIVSTLETLQKTSSNTYQLNIELSLFQRPAIGCSDNWKFALITNKLESTSVVRQTITGISTNCFLKNLNYPLEGELVLINNNEELSNYMEFTDSIEPEIDFANHTLLLTNGWFQLSGLVLSNQLIKIEENNYNLIIVVNGSMLSPSYWIHKLLLPKLSSEVEITLSVLH